ncbi:hypothetical protein Q9295_04255 [Xinfangfangia sp. CPCC 101601]|uniref:Fibronectin-binding protein n=1 Tax=Pseudogemmobacter lacusdianii TaxID=3069608 RepID=A0ABU0VV98_9RHOB|nr:hypothetical protein [Xinfangfangia sp. CPCC 101601]MDQ2065573.1 hypothetical protein [Xinfangfangia sp. CPCC 101601]
MNWFAQWTAGTAAVVATFALFGGAAHAADPTGVFRVEGMNPGGQGQYTGQVIVEGTGETYSVTWEIEGVVMQGVGIAYFGMPAHLSVAFNSDQNYGVAHFTATDDGNWTGTWAGYGGEVQGSELWTRQ